MWRQEQYFFNGRQVKLEPRYRKCIDVYGYQSKIADNLALGSKINWTEKGFIIACSQIYQNIILAMWRRIN